MHTLGNGAKLQARLTLSRDVTTTKKHGPMLFNYLEARKSFSTQHVTQLWVESWTMDNLSPCSHNPELHPTHTALLLGLSNLWPHA